MTFKEELKDRFTKLFHGESRRLNCTIVWEELERFLDQYETPQKKTAQAMAKRDG